MRHRKRALKTLMAIVIVCLAVVVGYIGYLLFDYSRIPDGQQLDIANQSAEPADTGVRYSIMTYNVGFGAYSADFSFFMDGGKYSRALSAQAVYDNIGGACKTLAAYNPDFVMLQEVGYDSDNSYHIDQRQLFYDTFPSYAHDFAINNHSAYLFYPLTCPFGRNNAGLLTMSRYAMETAVRRRLPIESGLTKFFDLDRCYAVTTFRLAGGQRLCLYTVHLSAYTNDRTIRDQQVDMLMDDMQQSYEQGAYVICGGDFNADLLGDSSKYFGISGADYVWAQAFPLDRLATGFTLAADSRVPSCRNADRPYDATDFVITIDGFIVSENVKVVSTKTVDTGFSYSDHNPVYMEFTLQ